MREALLCDRCGSAENVKRFVTKSHGTELLCWEHRWPYIEERLAPEPAPEESGTAGQSTLFDY